MVRATKDQLESLRKLLKQMGESQTPRASLFGVGAGAGSGRLRFVPVNRNSKRLLDDIQAWPTMRNNPINIVTPQAIERSNPQMSPDPNAAPLPAAGQETRHVGNGKRKSVPKAD